MPTDERSPIPHEWSFEAGCDALKGDHASEARTLDALDLLSSFYSDREDEVIQVLLGQLRNGRTPEIRESASLRLALTFSEGSSAALREALPDLDDETRRHAEIDLEASELRVVRAMTSSIDKRGDEEVRKDNEARLSEAGGKAGRRLTKFANAEERHEFSGDSLLHEPSVKADLAPGGAGYRVDFVPSNPRAAAFTVWMGARGFRFSVGAHEASFTGSVVTKLGWAFWKSGLRSYVRSVRNGRIEAYVSPDGAEALYLLPLAGKGVEEFKSSSAVPSHESLPSDWGRTLYEPYVG
jgi:hypothetical protein